MQGVLCDQSLVERRTGNILPRSNTISLSRARARSIETDTSLPVFQLASALGRPGRSSWPIAPCKHKLSSEQSDYSCCQGKENKQCYDTHAGSCSSLSVCADAAAGAARVVCVPITSQAAATIDHSGAGQNACAHASGKGGAEQVGVALSYVRARHQQASDREPEPAPGTSRCCSARRARSAPTGPKREGEKISASTDGGGGGHGMPSASVQRSPVIQ